VGVKQNRTTWDIVREYADPRTRSSSAKSKEALRDYGIGNSMTSAWRIRVHIGAWNPDEAPEPNPYSLIPIPYSLIPALYTAAANAAGTILGVPLRGPRLRALMTLIRSSNSSGAPVFLASRASAPWR